MYNGISITTTTFPSCSPLWDTDNLWQKTQVTAWYNVFEDDYSFRHCIHVGSFYMHKSAYDRRYLSDESSLFWTMDRLDGDLTCLFDFNGDGWNANVSRALALNRNPRYCNIWVIDYSKTDMGFFMSNKMLEALSIFITDFVSSDDFIIISAREKHEEKKRHFNQLNFIGIDNTALILDCHVPHHFFDVRDEEINKDSEIGYTTPLYYRYKDISNINLRFLRQEHQKIKKDLY